MPVIHNRLRTRFLCSNLSQSLSKHTPISFHSSKPGQRTKMIIIIRHIPTSHWEETEERLGNGSNAKQQEKKNPRITTNHLLLHPRQMAITDTIPRIDALREDRVILPAAAVHHLGLLARRQGRVEDGRVEVLGDLGLGDGFGRGEGGAGVIAGVLEFFSRGEGGVEGCWVEGLEDGRVTLVGVGGHALIDGAGFFNEVFGSRTRWFGGQRSWSLLFVGPCCLCNGTIVLEVVKGTLSDRRGRLVLSNTMEL